MIFGQGGNESGKEGKKKAKNAGGDSGGKSEVSFSFKSQNVDMLLVLEDISTVFITLIDLSYFRLLLLKAATLRLC